VKGDKQITDRQISAEDFTEAFGELYDEDYSKIFGYVLRRTASIEIAQDVTSAITHLNEDRSSDSLASK